MSDLQTEVKQLEEFLSQKSSFGNFSRYDLPEYEMLRAGAEQAGLMLARYEYIVARLKAICAYRELQVKSFVQGVRIPEASTESIEAAIADFLTDLHKGVYFK